MAIALAYQIAATPVSRSDSAADARALTMYSSASIAIDSGSEGQGQYAVPGVLGVTDVLDEFGAG